LKAASSVAFVGSDERGSIGWQGTYKRETIEVIISSLMLVEVEKTTR
jgi:hypothetical protein